MRQSKRHQKQIKHQGTIEKIARPPKHIRKIAKPLQKKPPSHQSTSEKTAKPP
jgi:hypothetical protein